MTVAITLMETYLIETLLAKGMEKETLIQHLKSQGEVPLNEFDNTFDYKELVEAFQLEPAKITKAIQTGYTIKFVSIIGIKRLLELKFGLDGDKDFEMHDTKILGITLNEQQLLVFKEMLSPNWYIRCSETGANQYAIDVLHNTVV